ncbi:hypothetical protein [Phenylobacterium montanum]|uniref:Uncharacterized protein n=1 Tax=Phenylobacterium montanum TaxID=2823693 RepID=A0A975FX83_9CAUL|nr:hypothetical protein [Caulobacter sp. S6]QUD86965.1 hypothetical protein KCG34_18080 [Caulobacter sp. S6]
MAKVKFKQCDLERILRASRETGVSVQVRIERLTGDLVVTPIRSLGSAETQPMEPGEVWSWDDYDAHKRGRKPASAWDGFKADFWDPDVD